MNSFVHFRLTHFRSRENTFTDYRRKYHFSKWQKNEMAPFRHFFLQKQNWKYKRRNWQKKHTHRKRTNAFYHFIQCKQFENNNVLQWHKHAWEHSLWIKNNKKPPQTINANIKRIIHFLIVADEKPTVKWARPNFPLEKQMQTSKIK